MWEDTVSAIYQHSTKRLHIKQMMDWMKQPKCRNNWFVSENCHMVCIIDTRYTCVSTNLEMICFPLPHVCIYILKWPTAEAIVSVFSISSCRPRKLLYKHHEEPSLHNVNSLQQQLLSQNAIQELWWPGPMHKIIEKSETYFQHKFRNSLGTLCCQLQNLLHSFYWQLCIHLQNQSKA